MKVLVTTIPFGSYDREPLKILEQANIDYLINPFERKISEKELAGIISDFDALIAGTEPITDFVLTKAKKLKIIARVGVGYNNINLKTAKEKSIKITYTPNGPDAAVTDLTIGLMYSLLRATHVSNLKLHQGIWERSIGYLYQDQVMVLFYHNTSKMAKFPLVMLIYSFQDISTVMALVGFTLLNYWKTSRIRWKSVS